MSFLRNLSGYIVGSAVVVGGMALLLRRNLSRARAEHAKFRLADVESALRNLVEPKPDEYFDEWDSFCAVPIDDPYLESVRQRCCAIVVENPGSEVYGLSKAALSRVAELLAEVRDHRGQQA